MTRTKEPTYGMWERRNPRYLQHCEFCNKDMSKDEYIYCRTYVGASENTERDYACKECIEHG